MSNLDKEFSDVVKEVADKVRQASELLVSVSKLCAEKNISVPEDDINNIKNIIEEIANYNYWDQSSTDNWISSSYNC